MKSTAVVFAATTLVAIAFACDDGSAPLLVIATATATATSVPAPAPTIAIGPTTAPAQLDAIVGALRAPDPATIRPLVGFRTVPCGGEGQTITGAPLCRLDEEEGQPVDVFYYAACEGQYLRPSEIDRALEVFAGTSLYALYRLPPAHRSSGDYVAIMTDSTEPRSGQAWEVIIDGGQIVALIFSCALPPDELIKLRGYTETVVEPEE